MKIKTNKIVMVIPFLVILISLIFIINNSLHKEEIVISGIVEATEIDVSSKIPGRIDSVLVGKSDKVKRGQILAILESKEMDAKVEQTKALMEAAKAKYQLVKNGVRSEEKEATQKLFEQAKSQFDYVSKTYERFIKLFNDKVISQQEMDEMVFKYQAAKSQMEAAKAKLNLVNKGARDEEITASEQLFFQAENAYKEALAYYDELKLKSPIDGEVYQIIADEGEIINSGYPIVTIIDKSKYYVTIQIREDLLSKVKIGRIIQGTIPSLNNNNYDFKVDYIAPMADFATWKPTNQKGDFDLRTFEIHLKPLKFLEDLKPGMTVNFIL
ncbi:HlyD family secretion protein [Stygiobacter electus]|uniref:Efflux RND transporter periplasmic adaptor subunit n=1 Tax=Stygiobacter electus TaxID=3032292 RepID=A0AAE3P093_9BACT|nr:efflux RND transporter periplasmic adaptor subunit [Stygiobacter electus]MDF1611885.1 efflux RND transporter periplasmic adaptor subunit [Stygiobacter electus]